MWDLGTLCHTGDVNASKDGSISASPFKVFNQNLQAKMCRTDSVGSLIPKHHGVQFKGMKRRKSKPSKNSLTCFGMEVSQACIRKYTSWESTVTAFILCMTQAVQESNQCYYTWI